MLPSPIPVDNTIFRVAQIILVRPERGKQGKTDVATCAQFGIATINFGPGDPDQCHQKDESINLLYLDKNLDIYTTFLTT